MVYIVSELIEPEFREATRALYINVPCPHEYIVNVFSVSVRHSGKAA